MGQLEKIVLAKPEQRAFQHGSEREIVLGLQQRIGEHQQVHHRQLIGERDPVGARHRDALAFQRGLEEPRHGLALAQQNKDIARLDGPPGGGKPLPAVEPMLDLRCDARRQRLRRAWAAGAASASGSQTLPFSSVSRRAPAATARPARHCRAVSQMA